MLAGKEQVRERSQMNIGRILLVVILATTMIFADQSVQRPSPKTANSQSTQLTKSQFVSPAPPQQSDNTVADLQRSYEQQLDLYRTLFTWIGIVVAVLAFLVGILLVISFWSGYQVLRFQRLFQRELKEWASDEKRRATSDVDKAVGRIAEAQTDFLKQLGLKRDEALKEIADWAKNETARAGAAVDAEIANIKQREASFLEQLNGRMVETAQNMDSFRQALERRVEDLGGRVSLKVEEITQQIVRIEEASQSTVEKDPNWNLGAKAYEERMYELAGFYWRRVLEKWPNTAAAHHNLGLALEMKGDLDAAIAEFTEAINFDPTLQSAHMSLGNALLKRNKEGDINSAIAEYHEVIRLDPKSETGHTNLGKALVKRNQHGDLDAAISEYRAAVGIAPGSPSTHFNLAYALDERLKEEDANEAIEEYRTVLKLNPDHVAALNNLGYMLAKRGLYDDSLALYQRGVSVEPNNAKRHYMLACAYSLKGDVVNAVGALRTSVILAPVRREMARTEKDFEKIRNDAQFRKLVYSEEGTT